MAKIDWFRNTDWNESIEAAFMAKLARCRDKQQCLRIQASTLSTDHPDVALKLLDIYFSLGEHFDFATAHVDRAAALLQLSQVEPAIEAYGAALERERKHPNVRTEAYLLMPIVVATHRLKEHYQTALNVLQQNKDELLFPRDEFLWNAASCLIQQDLGDPGLARLHAEAAMKHAAAQTSGLRYHPSLGLVTAEYDDIIDQLMKVLGQ